MRYFIYLIIAFALFITIVNLIKNKPYKRENSEYFKLLDKQQTSFTLPALKDSITWIRAINFLKLNSPVLASFNQYEISKEKIEKKYINDGHGFYILITAQRSLDSTMYKIHVEYSKHPAEMWEKKIALYMKTGLIN